MPAAGADEDIILGDAEDFFGVTIGDDHQVAMEMHRRLRLARGARGKPKQGDIVASGLHCIEFYGLIQRHPVEFGIMV